MEINKMVLDKATEALGGEKKPKRPKHGMRSTNIDHHASDGSHTVRHMPYEGEEITYAAKNNKELQAKLKQYLGSDEEAKEPAAEEASETPAEEAAEKA